MDKFSRTTEIDTAGVLSAIEEDTPKKSRKGNIIALIICIVVAIIIWAYVVETDTELHEKTFTDIAVTSHNDDYNITVKSQIDVTLKGTSKNLVDISKSEIIVSIPSVYINGEGEYKVPITCGLEAKIDNVQITPSVTEVLIQVTAK